MKLDPLLPHVGHSLIPKPLFSQSFREKVAGSLVREPDKMKKTVPTKNDLGRWPKSKENETDDRLQQP